MTIVIPDINIPKTPKKIRPSVGFVIKAGLLAENVHDTCLWSQHSNLYLHRIHFRSETFIPLADELWLDNIQGVTAMISIFVIWLCYLQLN